LRPAHLPPLLDHGRLPSGRSCGLAVGHPAGSAAAWRSGPRADPGALRPDCTTHPPRRTRSRTATAPARTGPPVRNDNRGAVRPIQPDGTGLSADDLGLAVTGAGGSRSLRPAGIRAATLVVRWRGRRSVALPCKGRRVDRVDRTEYSFVGCPQSVRKVRAGVPPLLENSTACRKLVP